MVMGTNTCGVEPSVVPVKSRGATPTIVSDCPLTMSESFNTFGSAPKRDCQHPWLSTATGDAPIALSSPGPNSRPSAGCMPRTGK